MCLHQLWSVSAFAVSAVMPSKVSLGFASTMQMYACLAVMTCVWRMYRFPSAYATLNCRSNSHQFQK